MSHPFNFEQWFQLLKRDSKIHDTYEEALLELVSNNVDIVQHHARRNFIVNEVGYIEKDNNGKYFVDVQIPRTSDIATNFVVVPYSDSNIGTNEVQLQLFVNGVQSPIDFNTKLVVACMMYTDMKIKMVFENEPFSVSLQYVSHLLRLDLRKQILYERFTHDGMRYSDGCVVAVRAENDRDLKM